MDLKISRYLDWIKFKDLVDELLKSQGLQKICTPYLVTSGALEAQLETFKVQKRFGSRLENLELPTSPEFHLKKALAIGFKDIYEIKTCFRNEENSNCHRAEFTMLEFYKVDCSLFEFITLVQKLLLKISEALAINGPTPTFKIYKISDLFANIGVQLNPKTDLQDLKKQANHLNIYTSESDDFDDIYFRIWLEKIEPFFDPQVFTIVHSYPPSQAALAEVNEEGWAARFEVYSHGIELGNAFKELGDSEEIEKRWTLENNKRALQGKDPHPIDLEFIAALDQMPPCCGIALGLERLYMVFYGLNSISDFQLFETELKNDITF